MGTVIEIDAKECKALAKEYTDGVSIGTLAQDYEISVPTMRKWLVRGGAKIRKPGKFRVGAPAETEPRSRTSSKPTKRSRTSSKSSKTSKRTRSKATAST